MILDPCYSVLGRAGKNMSLRRLKRQRSKLPLPLGTTLSSMTPTSIRLLDPNGRLWPTNSEFFYWRKVLRHHSTSVSSVMPKELVGLTLADLLLRIWH